MEGFTETLLMIIISVFIINLIASIYPGTKNKHTLLVIFSVITVYVCVSPLGALMKSLQSAGNFLSFGKTDSGVYSGLYEEELKSAMKKQIESEIDRYMAENYAGNSYAEAELSVGEEMSVSRIIIYTDGSKEEAAVEYIKENYGVTPEFRTRDDSR